MALDDIKPPEGITCPKYRRLPGSKRCQHFVDGGSCALPDELLCIEWVKLNPKKAEAYRHEHLQPEPLPGIEPPPSKKPPPRKPDPVVQKVAARTNQSPQTIEQLVSDSDVASLASLGLEICIQGWSEQDLWLVPERTAHDRIELTYRDAAALANTLIAFPGARVTQIRKGA